MGHSFQQYSFVTSVASVFNFQTPIQPQPWSVSLVTFSPHRTEKDGTPGLQSD